MREGLGGKGGGGFYGGGGEGGGIYKLLLTMKIYPDYKPLVFHYSLSKHVLLAELAGISQTLNCDCPPNLIW